MRNSAAASPDPGAASPLLLSVIALVGGDVDFCYLDRNLRCEVAERANKFHKVVGLSNIVIKEILGKKELSEPSAAARARAAGRPATVITRLLMLLGATRRWLVAISAWHPLTADVRWLPSPINTTANPSRRPLTPRAVNLRKLLTCGFRMLEVRRTYLQLRWLISDIGCFLLLRD